MKGFAISLNVTGIEIGIKVSVGIIEYAKHWNRNRNRMMLESESESGSKFLRSTGIGSRIGINPSGIGIGVRNTGPGIIYNAANYPIPVDHYYVLVV